MTLCISTQLARTLPLSVAALLVSASAVAQDAGTCTVQRASAQGAALGGDIIGVASRFGVVIAGERRTKLVLSRLEEARIRDVRRHDVGLGGPAVVRTYAGSPEGPAVIGYLDPRPGPRRRRPGLPTLVLVGREGLMQPIRVRGLRSLVNSALALTTDGRRIALVTGGPGQRPAHVAAIAIPETPAQGTAATPTADPVVQSALLPGRISGTPAVAWLGDRVVVAWASNDGGFGFVRLGIWTPGQTDPIEYRDVTPWRGEPPGDMALGASPDGMVLAWDIDEREGNVATAMAFVPNDPTAAATTLPMPWFGRAVARSANGPWVTVAHAEGNGALHVRVARGDQVADGVLRLEGAREVISAVVVPDGRGGAEGLAVGADGSRTRFSATCRLAAPSPSGVATAGSVAPAGERFPSLMGEAGACTTTSPTTIPVSDRPTGEPARWLASAASGRHVIAIASETAGPRIVVVGPSEGEAQTARSVAWPFATTPHEGMVAIDDAGDGMLAVSWVGPRQTFDDPAPGPPAATPVTRRIEAHPIYLGWVTPDGAARGEPIEILPLRAVEPRAVVVAAGPQQRAAVSVLDRAERARTRIAVVRNGAVERVVPLGRRVDSGFGIGWSGESIAAAWAAGNTTGSGYVHVLRWPQAGGSRPRWWIGGAWVGTRPATIVVAADTTGTNVGWIDRAPATGDAASAGDQTLALVRVPLADRAPSARQPAIRGRVISLARGPGGLAATVLADGRLRTRLVRQGTVAASQPLPAPGQDARRTTLAVSTEGAVVLGASGTGVTPLRLSCTPTEPRTP